MKPAKAWAYSKIGYRHRAAMECIVRASLRKINKFGPQDFSNLLYAVAVLELVDETEIGSGFFRQGCFFRKLKLV